MYRPAPRIEARSSASIVQEISRRLSADLGLDSARPDQATRALVEIFARYWEIMAVRLNQALDKNFLAYLDMLGVSPVPPTSATVPLTFVPVPTGIAGPRLVPARTQVAAAAGAGEAEPVVFETLHPLELTTAPLRHVFSLDPREDAETELAPVANAVRPEALPIFENSRRSDHALFIGDATLFSLDHMRTLRLRFETGATSSAGRDRRSVVWSVMGRKDAPVLSPSEDTTNGLSQSGEVVFEAPGPWPEERWRGLDSRWLLCQLTGSAVAGLSASYVNRIELSADVGRTELPLEAAFAESYEADLSKDFYPFGPRPVFGSTLYLASAEVFAHPGTEVILDVRLTNPHDVAEDPPIPRVYGEGHPRVSWEYWNGARWARLAHTDATRAFRINGSVSFQVPNDFSRATVRGLESAWVRARLVSGHYGEDERWDVADSAQPAAGLRHRPSTLAPPSIQSVTATYALRVVKVPDFVITRNERVYSNVSERAKSGVSFPLIAFPCGPRPALYCGLAAPHREGVANVGLNLYVLAEPAGQPVSRSGSEPRPALVRWQYWSGIGWQDVDAIDESGALTRSGRVELLVPAEIRVRTDFVDDTPSHWFRVVRQDESGEWRPAVRGILTNTVPARHTVTLEREVLGSSHAAPNHVFHALRAPILEGEALQVREAASAWALETGSADLAAEEIEIQPSGDTPGVRERWIRWHPVPDFLESGPADRHYVVDREIGQIRFGDGRRGRIPPAGSNNIRLHCYQVGGGSAGNKDVGEVNQLRSAVPYVESVVNLVPARGGVDVEHSDLVRHRGATTLRHRGRAVTREDYEDLARLASPEVGRAVCVPLRDLADRSSRQLLPGVVSLIVIPGTKDRRPFPAATLLRQVRSYLDRYRNPATDLVVVGPDYVQITVQTKVVVSRVSEAARIAGEVKTALEGFLHPLFGGPTREGWRLGELPTHGDLCALCASVAGVTYLDSLHVIESEDRTGAIDAGSFLIYSGLHEVVLRYAGGPEAQPVSSGFNGVER